MPGLAFAARAAKSAPLRNVAARGAKVAAKAAVAGALFSNPITAPLGLIAAESWLPTVTRGMVPHK